VTRFASVSALRRVPRFPATKTFGCYTFGNGCSMKSPRRALLTTSMPYRGVALVVDSLGPEVVSPGNEAGLIRIGAKFVSCAAVISPCLVSSR